MTMRLNKIDSDTGVDSRDWQSWTWQYRRGLVSLEDFERRFALSDSERRAFARPLALQTRVTPYFAAVAQTSDAVRRTIVPRADELLVGGQQLFDPLGEREHAPRPRLVHRYPDRVLFLVTDQCSLYCRYCLRKHFTGGDQAVVGSKAYDEALEYLRGAHGVREVILSGGDPLMLSDGRLDRVLGDLRAIEHVEIVRIGSRMPVVNPMRITPELATLLRKHKPIFLMTHFNHPDEVTTDAAEALERLVDHGVPVFNQMVLLNGVNNHAALIQALSRRLLRLRVKPYYMFQCDPSEGSEHFRTSLENSLAIQRELWGKLSGLAMPNLSMDIPGGGGKVGFTPDLEAARDERGREFHGWDGVVGRYEKPTGTIETPVVAEAYREEWARLESQSYGGSLF